MTGGSNGRGTFTLTAHSQTLTYPKFGKAYMICQRLTMEYCKIWRDITGGEKGQGGGGGRGDLT